MFSMDRKYIHSFIEKYKSLTCLWKVKCEEYKNKYIRNAAYNELLTLTRDFFPEADLEFVKKKINNLRTAFRKEFRKCQAAQMTGDVYTPSLWYFELLLFTGDQETDPLEEDDSEYNLSITPVLLNEQSPHSQDSIEQVILNLPDRSRKRKQEDSEPYMYYPRSRPDTETPYTNDTVNCNKDLFDAYGLYVAAKLRCMNKHQRVYAENVINQALFCGAIGELSAASTVNNSLFTHVSLSNQVNQETIGTIRSENNIKTEVTS